jgi:hypothetical protein
MKAQDVEADSRGTGCDRFVSESFNGNISMHWEK